MSSKTFGDEDSYRYYFIFFNEPDMYFFEALCTRSAFTPTYNNIIYIKKKKVESESKKYVKNGLKMLISDCHHCKVYRVVDQSKFSIRLIERSKIEMLD